MKPLFGRRPSVIADAVQQLLDDPSVRVGEKSSITVSERIGQMRRPTARDVAVLTRTGASASAIASALRVRGHDVLISGAGLLATPEASLALACLHRFLDSGDSLAAAEVVALEALHEVEEWVDHRLHFAQNQTEPEAVEPWLLESSPALNALHAATNDMAGRNRLSPLGAFNQATQIAGVSRIISRWGPTTTRSNQGLANLSQLRWLIEDYENRCAQFGLPATFNGLFGWLDDLAENGQDSFPKLTGGDAIHVGTYHSAKGLEWPVVFLADLDWAPRTGLFNLRITDPVSGGIDFNDPLGGRELRLWINPFGGKQKHPPIEQLESSATGQRVDQAQRNEALRLLYIGFTRARDRLVLLHEPLAKPPGWLLELGVNTANAILNAEEIALSPGAPIPASKTLHQFSGPPGPPPVSNTLDLPISANTRTERAPAILTPSSQSPVENARVVDVIEFGERLEWSGHPNERNLGEAMHRIIATEILNPEAVGQANREDRAAKLLDGFGIAENLNVSKVLESVDGYRKFMGERFQLLSEAVEVPFTVRNISGQRITGFIDHLLETEMGPLVVDHKIFPGRRNELEPKALSYSGQLDCYRRAVGREALLAIHLVTLGALVLVEIP